MRKITLYYTHLVEKTQKDSDFLNNTQCELLEEVAVNLSPWYVVLRSPIYAGIKN